MKTLAILLLLTLSPAISQEYISVGSSTAKIPHTNKLTPNILLQAGVNPGLFDVSINVEYVQLTPNYLSYYGQVLLKPFHQLPYKLQSFIGAKYGRIIRKPAAYSYYGITGELRYNLIRRLFIALAGNYDYRGDIKYMWGKDYLVYTTHLKVGYKF